MKPFVHIATPHNDIIEGKLTLDIFAADLWQVVNNRAPTDYKDPVLFFRKTYLTKGLNNILNIAESRLKGRRGDSIIQLQTPFGGGKTHTLIALYHKAKEWGAKVVVLDGTVFNPKESKLWEEIERQLTGKIELTKGDISPGKEKLERILLANSPVLILMDEIAEYITKASGIKVGDSNLASQTLAFLQELTGAVSANDKAMLILTLPSSNLEYFDEKTEKIAHQIQKILGRVERVYTPVEEEEIEHVIRARLFYKINEKELKEIVDEFVDYAYQEKLLSDDERIIYREKFLKSYPFKPEVIDTLYKKWGSFPTFQRTRGVLRILSLVIYESINKEIPFIRLGDFNLANHEIRRELIKHIGNEWDSVISEDIASEESGAKKVDKAIGVSFAPYKLGTVVSTTIFMSSFSGKGRADISINKLKLSTIYPNLSSTVIDTVVDNLKQRLFYLSDEGLFFNNQPNLNKIIISKTENILENDIKQKELELIKKYLSNQTGLKIYIFPKNSKDIPDTPELKLVIFGENNINYNEFIEKYGEIPRIYRNTLIFLSVDENQRKDFYNYLKKLIALKQIELDKKLNLSEAQRKELKSKIKNEEQREYEELRKFYRKLSIPQKQETKKINMGITTVGENQLDKEIYNHLRHEGIILQKIAPIIIKERYLQQKEFIELKKLYESFLKTPGEYFISKEAFIQGIKEGIKMGFFAFGEIQKDKIIFKTINSDVVINLIDSEIIINPEMYKPQESKAQQFQYDNQLTTEHLASQKSQLVSTEINQSNLKQNNLEQNTIEKTELNLTQELKRDSSNGDSISYINLKFRILHNKLAIVSKIANLLKNRFEECYIEITIQVKNGKITKSEYENLILETLNQSNAEIISEQLK